MTLENSINYEEVPETPPQDEKPTNCPKCQMPMVERNGKFGPFLACSGYPNCKYIHKTGFKSQAGSSLGSKEYENLLECFRLMTNNFKALEEQNKKILEKVVEIVDFFIKKNEN